MCAILVTFRAMGFRAAKLVTSGCFSKSLRYIAAVLNSDCVDLCLRTTWPCWCDAFADLLAGNKLHELLGRFGIGIISYFWGAWVQQVHINVVPLQGTSRATVPRSAASAVMTLGTSTKRRAGWVNARNAPKTHSATSISSR